MDKNLLKLLYTENRFKKSENHPSIKAPELGYIQADLMETNLLHPRKNKGIKYLLNLVDVYSRFVWVFALKNKKSSSVLECLKSVHKKFPFITFTSDYGSEFRGDVKKWLEEENIKQYLIHPDEGGNNTAIVERFNRTLSSELVLNINNVWYDKIDEIVDNYNNSVHSTVGEKPIDIVNLKAFPVNVLYSDDYVDKFKIKDYVLLKNKEDSKLGKKSRTFNFGFVPFEIIGVDGYRYKLKNLINNKTHSYKALQRELKKITKKNVDDLILNNEKLKKMYNENLRLRNRNKLVRQQSIEF